MRSLYALFVLSLLAPATFAQPTIPLQPTLTSDYCYIVADQGGGNGGNDWLAQVNRLTGNETAIGTGTGTNGIESVAYWPLDDELYAVNANVLGILSRTTGEFTAIGTAFGQADGAEGPITIDDVDALSFDPHTGILYGAHRRDPGDDLLVAIDSGTGALVANHFGAGVDYIVALTTAATGFGDVDDFAIDPEDGTLYAIANDGGANDRLVSIDLSTGVVTNIGSLGQDDMEGMAFDAFGVFYGTTGSVPPSNSNAFFTIDKTTGTASKVGNLGVGTDYESVACLTDGFNTASGTVFLDEDVDGTFDTGLDVVYQGATINFYRDSNGDGAYDAGDRLLNTTTSAADGTYSFAFAATGNFVITIDPTTVPQNRPFTTGQERAVAMTGFGNTSTGNDFGYAETDLAIDIAINDPMPNVNDNVIFTTTLTNESLLDASGVVVTDAFPTLDGLAFVSATPSVGTYDETTGVWTVGNVPNGTAVTLLLEARVTKAEPQILNTEVTATNEYDKDSTPNNGDGLEDDWDVTSIAPVGSSGGGEGGIESNGTLGQQLGRVLYQRRHPLDGTPLRPADAPFPFERALMRATAETGTAPSVADLLPVRGPMDSTPYVVSPTDLLGVTNARNIFAADYLRSDDRRVAAVFSAVSAPDALYEHTKVICDRVRGGALLAVSRIEVDGRPFILSRFRQDDGRIDHAISFVIYTTASGYVVDSRYALEDYSVPAQSSGEILNVQVWSVDEAFTAELVDEMLATLSSRGQVAFMNTPAAPPAVPSVFVRSGRYAQGEVTLELYNAAGASRIEVTGGTLSRYEGGPQQPYTTSVTLPVPAEGEAPIVEVTIPTGPIYDAGFYIETEGGRDVLYFADGSWGYQFDEGEATVASFAVSPAQDATYRAGQWTLERPVRLAGDVRDTATLYRYLRASGKPMDLSAYQYVEFTASGEGAVAVMPEKATVGEGGQFSKLLRLSDTPTSYRIWFEDFRNGAGQGGFTAEDVVTLSFHPTGNREHTAPFVLDLTDVRFGGADGDPLATVPEDLQLKSSYPNPARDHTTFAFGVTESAPVRIGLYDLLGREVARVTDRTYEPGRYTIPFDVSRLASGLYVVRMDTPTQSKTGKLTVLR